MAFDHAPSGGGGPDRNDRRHAPVRGLVRRVLQALGAAGKHTDLCMECLAVQTAASSLALLLMQQDAVDLDTGEINHDRMQRIMQAVTDIAMAEIEDVVSGRSEEGGQE